MCVHGGMCDRCMYVMCNGVCVCERDARVCGGDPLTVSATVNVTHFHH